MIVVVVFVDSKDVGMHEHRRRFDPVHADGFAPAQHAKCRLFHLFVFVFAVRARWNRAPRAMLERGLVPWAPGPDDG